MAEAAAVGVEDKNFGQRLRAFVVLEQGKKASEDELKDYVKSDLGRYKVPREVVFMDELPATSPARCSSASSRGLEPERAEK